MKVYIVNKSCYNEAILENVIIVGVLDEKEMITFSKKCVEKGKEIAKKIREGRERYYSVTKDYFERQKNHCLAINNQEEAEEWEIHIKRLNLNKEIEFSKRDKKVYKEEDYIYMYLNDHDLSIEEKELNQIESFWLNC